jgi:hypothetical protein
MKTDHGPERNQPGELKTVRASLVPAAVGLDRSMSRYDAYRLVAYGEEKPVSDYVQRLRSYGTRMEPKAIGYVELILDEPCFHSQKRFKRERFTGHVDGLMGDAVVEVKSRDPSRAAYEVGDRSWTKHMAQVQQLMYLADKPHAYFACYCVHNPSRLWKVLRSDRYLEKLHELLAVFIEFIDGEKPCPKRINQSPTMPSVEYELLDGPEEETTVTELVQSVAAKQSESIGSVQDLDALEERLLVEYPGQSEWILRGTEHRRQQLIA